MPHYRGEGTGRPFHVAINKAVDMAWEDAKSKGHAPEDELKLVEVHVKGQNPVNWTRVVLSDD